MTRRAPATPRRAAAATFALVVAAGLALAAAPAGADCPPAGMTKASLQGLKDDAWRVPDDTRRQGLALELLDCLGAADPELRDELAFEALSHWIRGKQITAATLQSMRALLLPLLKTNATDTDSAGFRQPFAALTLAEVARADRVQPLLSATQRAELVAAATTYLTGVHDYRGFDEKEGWRHGVAHGADLLLQLSVNPALDRDQLAAILASIASQVMPPGGHFYVYGEGDRLTTPVFYIGPRRLHGRGVERVVRGPGRAARDRTPGHPDLARRETRPQPVSPAALRFAEGERHAGDAVAHVARRRRSNEDPRLNAGGGRSARARGCHRHVLPHASRAAIRSASIFAARTAAGREATRSM